MLVYDVFIDGLNLISRREVVWAVVFCMEFCVSGLTRQYIVPCQLAEALGNGLLQVILRPRLDNVVFCLDNYYYVCETRFIYHPPITYWYVPRCVHRTILVCYWKMITFTLSRITIHI